jgi:hypothetical protein
MLVNTPAESHPNSRRISLEGWNVLLLLFRETITPSLPTPYRHLLCLLQDEGVRLSFRLHYSQNF